MDALKRNYFEFFSLPAQFDIDEQALEQAFRRLQSSMHPDRFVNSGDAEKRYAMQLATKANQAHQILNSPLQRARYLCELNGQDVGADDNTAMPAQFLIEQMGWHEALDEVRETPDAVRLKELIDQNLTAQLALQETLRQSIDQQQDYAAAADAVRQYMFLDRFAQQLIAVGRSEATS